MLYLLEVFVKWNSNTFLICDGSYSTFATSPVTLEKIHEEIKCIDPNVDIESIEIVKVGLRERAFVWELKFAIYHLMKKIFRLACKCLGNPFSQS